MLETMVFQLFRRVFGRAVEVRSMYNKWSMSTNYVIEYRITWIPFDTQVCTIAYWSHVTHWECVNTCLFKGIYVISSTSIHCSTNAQLIEN